MRGRRTLIKNAAANLARGGAISMVSVLLPPFLVRHMQPAVYATWILVLQTAAYAGLLDFGLQTAVGRYIAFARERNDIQQRDTIFSTAFLGLQAAAILNTLLLLTLIAFLRHIFPAVPAQLIPSMRWALMIAGVSVAAGLPASAWNGVFVGLQRNEIPAITTLASRLLMVAGLVAAVYAHGSLVVLAGVVAASNLFAYAAQYAFLGRLVPDLRFTLSAVRASAARELFGYCLALTVMTFSMLLINGFDLTLVGRFDFKAIIPYSVAAGLVPLIGGCLYAVLNAMMPHAAALHAQNKPLELGRAVIASTRMSVLILVFTGTPILAYAGPLLRLWIGPGYVGEGKTILAVLLIANMVRLMGAAYSIVLVAAGQHVFVKISPVTEGITNFVASVLLGATIGGVGVAYGTLIGAVVSIGSHLFYSMPRTVEAIQFSRRTYLLSGIAAPLLSTSPLLAAAGAAILGLPVGATLFCAAAILSVAASAALLGRHHAYPRALQPLLRGVK